MSKVPGVQLTVPLYAAFGRFSPPCGVQHLQILFEAVEPEEKLAALSPSIIGVPFRHFCGMTEQALGGVCKPAYPTLQEFVLVSLVNRGEWPSRLVFGHDWRERYVGILSWI